MTIRHTIEAFTEPITALPTDPQLAPEELKRRLQAPAEELRAAHNALAKEVGGIADATYPDTVTREMLTPEVKQEIAAKAEQSALESEAAAREELASRVSAAENALPTKTEVYFGAYRPSESGVDNIELGFKPKAVLLMSRQPTDSYAIAPLLATADAAHSILSITETGFAVAYHKYRDSNSSVPYHYIAFK